MIAHIFLITTVNTARILSLMPANDNDAGFSKETVFSELKKYLKIAQKFSNNLTNIVQVIF